MLKLVPQARFFDLFEKQSDLTMKGAAALRDLIYDFRDSPAKAVAIKKIEHEADLVTHEIFRNLNTTFVCPRPIADRRKTTLARPPLPGSRNLTPRRLSCETPVFHSEGREEGQP
jgi:hypothetical protein